MTMEVDVEQEEEFLAANNPEEDESGVVEFNMGSLNNNSMIKPVQNEDMTVDETDDEDGKIGNESGTDESEGEPEISQNNAADSRQNFRSR